MKSALFFALNFVALTAAVNFPFIMPPRELISKSVVAEKQDIACKSGAGWRGGLNLTEIYTASCLQAGSVGKCR